MRPICKILVGVTAVATLALLAAPAVQAQCATSQAFASVGSAMAACAGGGCKQVSVSTAGVHNGGKEIGRFWVANDSARGNNFGGSCPSTAVITADSWWDVVGANRGLAGGITLGGCLANTCPSNVVGTDQMMFLVEEWGPGGPPGIGGTAFWIGMRTDPTPTGSARVWDVARVSGVPPVNVTLPFLEFPKPIVTASSRVGPNVSTTNNFVDIGLNMHASPVLSVTDSASILTYDLCTFHGATDPGRLRSAGWSCTTPGGGSIPYSNAAVSGAGFTVPCTDILADTWFAIGITFSGGSGPHVPSAMVGSAVQVECNPTIANPKPLDKPSFQPVPRAKPAPRSGR
jgi:hypothetical protein